MATAVDVPPPVCETREEQGGDLVDQATSILIKALPSDEQSEAHADNGLSTGEGYNFLTAPSAGGVHCEVHHRLPDVGMVTEKPDQTVKDEADIVHLGKLTSDDQPTEIAASEETVSGGIQQKVEETKTHTSTEEKVGDGKQREEDTLENPAGSLHVAPENIEASILGQEKNIKSFPEDQIANGTLHENTGGETEEKEKSIDAVDTQKEILESVSTIASSSPEEGSINAVPLELSSDNTDEKIVDETGTQKEVLEKDFSNVSNEDVKGNSIENGEPRNVEFCENESAESPVLKIESKMEKPEDPLRATLEDINAPEIEARSCIEEQNVATHPQGILDQKTEDEAVDAAEKEGIIENVPSAVSLEKTEDNSLTQVGGENEDFLEKDAEKPSPIEDLTENTVTDEVKFDDKNPSREELLEDKNTESALLKEEAAKEKPLESLHAALVESKPSDLDQHTETTSFLEEKSPSENPQEILGEETQEKTIAVSNEDNSKGSSIQVDARELEQDAYLKKEMEPSVTKASVEYVGNKCNEDSQSASEDHKAPASSENIETTHSHEESLVMSDSTIDVTNTEEATHENVATEIQHEHTEENSVTLVDCSQIEEEEHLGKDGENSSWTEAPIEETKADELKNIQEHESKGIDSMKAELENEKDAECTSVKEGAEVDNPIDSLQTANDDIKASDSSQDTNTCIAEQLPTAISEELPCDQTERESVDAAESKEESLEDIKTNIPDGDKAVNTPIEEDDSQEPSLKDTTLGDNNAEDLTAADEAKPVGENEKITECAPVKEEVSTETSALGKDEETSSLEEKSLTTEPQGIMDDTEDKTDGAIVAMEETLEDKENIEKATPCEDVEENILVQEDYPQMEQKKELENDGENTSSREVLIGETTEGTSDKEEAQVEKPTEDIKESESCQETYPVDEKILIADPEEIPCDKTEETTTGSAYTKNENLELQNVENVPNEGSDNSQAEVEGPEKTSLEETSVGNNNDAKFADEHVTKADLIGNEESIECTLVKGDVPLKSLQEEAQEEKPIDSSQAAQEEIKASDSSRDTICCTKDRSLTAYPQEISSDKTERESVDAINSREESIEDIPGEDDAVNSQIEEDGSQEPHLKEATTMNDNDEESTVTDETQFVAENEKDIECALVKEEVSTELLQVAAQDTKVPAIGQDRETSSLEVQSLTTDPQGFVDETKEDKTNDATGAEEGTPEDKDVATTPCEDIEENLPVEVDCKQAEQNEDLVNDSEHTSLTEALIGGTGEGTLVKEEAHEEKNFESLQVANEDIQESDSFQETSLIEEQILTDDSKEISCDNVEEKSIDAAYDKKEDLEEVATKIPNASDEDNSPIQVDGLQKPSVDEASTIIHEAKFVDESKVESDLSENESKTECGLVLEEASVKSMEVESEDIKPTASSEDREISQLKGQDLTTNPQEIVGDCGEGKTIDLTELKEETLEDKSIAHEDTIENSSIQVDCIQLEKNENLEKASKSTSLAEAPTAETTENILVKEKAEEADHPIETLQVANEDIQASDSCQETGSTEEQIITGNSQEISCDRIEEKNIDAACTEKENLEEVAMKIPNPSDEDNSPIQVDDLQKPPLEEASTLLNEDKHVDESKVEADMSQNESKMECGLVQEEVSVKSMQVENEDIKPTTSSQDREISQLKGQDLTTNSQEIVGDSEGKTIDVTELKEDVLVDKSNATTPHEDTIGKSLVQVDCIQLEQNEHIVKPSESTSLTEAPTADTTENILVKEKAEGEDHHIETPQVEIEDIQASDSLQETSLNEEQIPTDDSKEISCDSVEEKSIDAACTEKENLEEVATKIPNPSDEDNSPIQVDCLQKSPLEEASTLIHEDKFVDESKVEADLSQNESKTECGLVQEEVSVKSMQVESEDVKPTASSQDREISQIKGQDLTTNPQELVGDYAEGKTTDATELKEDVLVDKEQNENLEKASTSLTEAPTADTIENVLVKEKAEEEDHHIETLQVATEDIQASDSCQETDSTEEQIITSDSQEIACDRIEEKNIDAASTEKENLEDVAMKIPNMTDEDNSPIQVADLQKSPLEEASTLIHEDKYVDESKVEADVSQNESKTECGLVQEEVSVKSMQVENEDIKPTASSQDGEISQLKGRDLTINPQEIVGDYIEGKTIDVTELKEETLEDKEQNENLEKTGEDISLTEAPTVDNTETILVKEKAEEEDHHIEILQVATEDIQASDSRQETSSTEEQILTGDSQEISCDRVEEKNIDAAYTGKESFEDVVPNVPSEDNDDCSPIEVDCSQKQSLEEASTENTNDHESTIRHDTKFADDLSQNEKNVECDLVKEEASVKSMEVEDEDIKSITSNQERETGHIVTHEDKSYATISYEDATENSSVQEDCSKLEQNEHSEKDNEITSLTEALETDTKESTLVKEEAQDEDHTESLQVADEDIVSFSPCQDTERSSTEEQVLTVDPEDISSDKIIEKTIDASDNEKTTEVQVENEDIKVVALSQDKETSHLEEPGLNTDPQGIMGGHKEDKTADVPDFKEESLEDKSYATTSYEDSEERSFVQVDCSQLERNEHPEKDGESTSLTDAPAADTIERTLVKEEAQDEDHIESLHSATEDVKAFDPSQDTKTSSTEEQILTVDSEDISRDKTIESIIDASEKEEKNTEGALKEDAFTESSQEANEDIKAANSSKDRDVHSQKEQTLGADPEGLKDENRENETFTKDEVPKETENTDFEARNTELKEEEGSLKDMSTSVDMAAPEEKDSDSIAEKVPCTKDLDVVEEVAVGHQAEDPVSKQEESSIKVVPEVPMIISHENVQDVTSLASEVVEETKSGGDRTVTENIAVLDDGSTMIPTNETLPETDPTGGTEAEVQVPDGEKEAELVQHDSATETDQKFIEGELLIKDSQVISESKGVNDEEEKTNSDNCEDGSSNSAALTEESTSNFQESRREMREEAENEEAQKQDEELHVSAIVHDLSSGEIENQVEELEKAPLPASDENVTETTECKESETVEDAIKSNEGDDRTESFFSDKNATEKEQEKTESRQEKLTSDEKVQTTLSTSNLEVIDFLPTLPTETPKVEHCITEGEVATDREELNTEKTATDGSQGTIIDNNRSITGLESKNDDEAPEAIQTTPSASEGQDVESTSVGETTALISECPRDGYEHANISSTTGEGPDSKEVVFEPEEQRIEYGSKIPLLESVSQVQSCKTVAETEETKAEEKGLETAGETEPEKVEAEDISVQEETKHEQEILKENNPCQKIKEGDEYVEDSRQGSHQEEVITGSHLVEEANQGQEISRGFEDIKKENEMETVPKLSKEADDKALEEPEEDLLGKESIDTGLDKKEHSKSVQEVTTALDTEMVQVLDVGCIKEIGTQNSNEEINRSTVAFPDEEENRTGADVTENEIAEDEGLLNQNSKSPEIDAAERELPKELDENITCEAPTSEKTIEDPEVKKEQQEELTAGKHEILPLPESVQGAESEKQNQKDEICGSDEVQPRDEENVTRLEEKGEEENKADTWNKPNEGEETETYVEPEQDDFSFHIIKDISEVPISDGVQVIPEDNESSITKVTSPEEDCSNKSIESEIPTVSNDAELTEPASEATCITTDSETLEQEREQQQLGRAPGNVTEVGVNCEEVKIRNDKSIQLENSWSAETEKVSDSKTTAQRDNVEGSPRQIDSLSILPEAKCPDIETAEKEHGAGLNDTGVTELKDKHAVLEADHTTVLSSENTNGNEKLSTECSQGEQDLPEPSKVEQQEADCGNDERTDQEKTGKPESEETNKPSLSDLFDVSMRETSKMAEHSATDEEPTTHTEGLHGEKPDEDQHENAKAEEEHDEEDESNEQKRAELSSEAPVIVDMPDADVKASHKKSHNILSGVGSKVKHSIAKVKKAITGKSSHPKPPSPKKSTIEK